MNKRIVVWIWLAWGVYFFSSLILSAVEVRASSEPVKSAALTNKPVGEVNVDEVQRTEARKHIPELFIFLATAMTLAFVLWLKARDVEELREKGFYKDRDSNGENQ